MSEISHRYGVKDGVVWLHPVSGNYISSPFGYRWHPITKKYAMHNGVDISMPSGSPIYASRSGYITTATYHNTAGNYIVIEHTVEDGHGGDSVKDGYKSAYMHMTKFADGMKVGKYVTLGDVIGYVGSTGRSTGPHLHFGIYLSTEYEELVKDLKYNNPQQRYNSGDRIYVDPNLFVKINSGYSTAKISDLLTTANQPPWVDKQPPNYDDFKPLFTGGSAVSNSICNIDSILIRRGLLLSNSSDILFDNGKVNLNVGLGYNNVGINSFHPKMGSSRISASVVTQEAREHINNDIAKTSSGGYRKGPLGREDQDFVAGYILSYLCGKGWSPNAVFGVLGNMVGESGLNPARWEDDIVTSVRNEIRGFGLVQWTPWNKHFDWCATRGYNPYDVDGQLEHLHWEFTDPSADQYYKLTNSYYVNGYYGQLQKSGCYEGELRDYIEKQYNTQKPRIVPLEKMEFIKSNLSQEILAIGFATNYERPSIQYMHPNTRVLNATRFSGILSNRCYTPRSSMPKESDISEHWISRGSTFGGIKGVNPFLMENGHICNSTLYTNNGYAWGRAIEILSSYVDKKDAYKTLCINRSRCWYEDNIKLGRYEYDKLPRVGSIICWKNKKYGGISDEMSYVGIVEEVLGSDVITVSKMSDKGDSKGFSCSIITNENNNWGLNPSKYEFKGFIHILPQTIFYPNIKLTNDGEIQLSCNSSSGESVASVLFGMKDAKHFNKVKIVYDMIVSPPKMPNNNGIDGTDKRWDIKYKDGEDGDIQADDGTLLSSKLILNDIDNYCNFYVHLNQQTVSCVPSSPYINEQWPNTYFPTEPSENSTSDDRNMGYPFPDGAVLLDSKTSGDITQRSKFKPLDGSYALTDLCKTVSLHKCEYEGEDEFNVFSGGEAVSGGVKKFNRELPTYLSLTVVSLPATHGNTQYETSVTVNIKKIILYG